MSRITINHNKCNLCLKCLELCHSDSIEISNNKVIINDTCSLCKICISVCPNSVFGLHNEILTNDSKNNVSHISIMAEHFMCQLASHVPELIAKAESLKSSFSEAIISVILVGDMINEIADEILLYGVDEVWIVKTEKDLFFQEDVFTEIIAKIVKQKKPDILVGGATVFGRSVFPRLAAKLLTGLTADCTELSIDQTTGLLLQTRPAFNGNLMATITTRDVKPQMATVRPGIFKPKKKSAKGIGKKVYFNNIEHPGTALEVVDFLKERADDNDISDKDIVIAFGRGVQKKENIILINKLAECLNASIGATRAVVDSGWIHSDHQIGQTGKVVSPRVYIGCGISGSVQHQIGMKNSDCIIAINSDRNAPIFDIADYGLIGDLVEVIPELINKMNNW